ncbi:MAG: cyclic nucleotide-binding domain-containing protein [Nitrospirae bacterium]|nr:MAG: cyclic nucleotide-binding domain-containing protein [Nitrospirota bacterium]
MISSVYIFEDLDAEEKKTVEGLLKSRECTAGEEVYREGEPGGTLNIVESGRVSINKTMVEGDQYCMASLRQGEVFGVLSFLDRSRHDATISAEENTKILVFEREAFDRLMCEQPMIAAKMLRRIALHLSSIVKSMNSQQRDLMHMMFRKSK